MGRGGGGGGGRGESSIICMPGVAWLMGRLLSVPGEGPSGRGGDTKTENNVY